MKPSASATNTFTQEFAVLSQAGVGVFVVRTREPHRVRRALMGYAFAIAQSRKNGAEEESRPFDFGSWDRVFGWRIFTPTDDNPKGDSTVNALDALGNVAAVNADEANAFKEGVYVMESVHPDFQDPQFLQLIKIYAHEVTGDRDVTIVLTVPEGTPLPLEIQDDVKILNFTVPSQSELEDRTKAIVTQRRSSAAKQFANFKDSMIQEWAQAGRGLSLLDFEHALDRGMLECVLGKEKPAFKGVTRTILGSKTDVVKRSEVLELIQPCKITDIGGYGVLKEHVADYGVALDKGARDYGIDPPKGLLLVGVQGTGKSLAAKSVGSVLNLNTVRFDIGRCFGQYVGQSEARAEAALEQAIAMAPVVVWIDEIDKGGFGTSGDSNTSDRVLAKLLTKMQESGDKGIVWILSANRVVNLPPELIRMGRIDDIFFLGLPTIEERREVFNIHLRKRGHAPEGVKNLESAVIASEGYTPAEIESIVNKSLLDAYKQDKKTTTGELLCARLAISTPMSKKHKKDVDAIIEWGANNAINASGKKASNPGSKKEVRTLRDR